VSIVTSSYNQGEFIGRTIESVQEQDYPDIEHIVVDGMSTDATVDVLARYPHLKVIREPDRGQADAITGAWIASGQILGRQPMTSSSRATHVVDAIDPSAGRYVVMGRCRFIDERPILGWSTHGFESHRRVPRSGRALAAAASISGRELWE
jgi:glycosyltransferase involved in cell wall biosynthesis